MHITHKNGILFRDKEDLYVDASGLRGKNALITHAHSDHAKATKSNTYYLTRETALLMGAAEKNIKVKEMPFGAKFSLSGFDCCMRPSGHILGSAQIEVANGRQVVLTSDFKLQESILFKGAEILPSETLVIETTFGLPEFSFPKREDVYEDMIRWMHRAIGEGKFIVLGGYSTGKAQELTKIVNEFLGQVPIVHPKIFRQNKVYESEGVALGGYYELNHNLKDSNVLIYPPFLVNDDLLFALEHQLGKKVEAAIATGWNFRSKYKIFPLSDHADYNSLLRYVKESNPKLVLTTHGFEQEFANAVKRKLGINARPLSKGGQMGIGEFSGSN